MSRKCDICGKGPVVGHNVSHAKNRTPRVFRPNLFKVRALVDGTRKRVKVCSRCLRSGAIIKG